MSTSAMPPLPEFAQRLKVALQDDLKTLGISARIVLKVIHRTHLLRVYVVSDDFEEMQHDERQKVVWNIAERTLEVSDRRRIAAILTLTKDEAADEVLKIK